MDTKLSTRAVERAISPGDDQTCPHCDERVSFKPPKMKGAFRTRVVCNIYKKGRWDRMEIYHYDCYEDAGQPHGPVERLPKGSHLRGGKPTSKPAKAMQPAR